MRFKTERIRYLDVVKLWTKHGDIWNIDEPRGAVTAGPVARGAPVLGDGRVRRQGSVRVAAAWRGYKETDTGIWTRIYFLIVASDTVQKVLITVILGSYYKQNILLTRTRQITTYRK